MHRRLRHLAVTSVLAALGALLLPVTAASAVATDEVYVRPGDGVFGLAGHGWGHGRGLSQWGADGAASKKGMTGPQIAGFYYPKTAQAVLSDRPIRVLVDCPPTYSVCDSPTSKHPLWSAVELSAANGVLMSDTSVSGAAPAKLPTDRSRWRVTVDSAGKYRLSGLVGGTWSAYPNATTAYTGPLELSSNTGSAAPLVRLYYSKSSASQAWREYRGVLRPTRSTGTTLRLVNRLGMESYLLGVVPRESPSSWPHNALFAQAIAARSYSGYQRDHAPSTQSWDICDTTWCQVYWGAALGKRASDGTVSRVSLEPASTTKAVRCYVAYYPKPTDPTATADPCSAYAGPLVRTYNGKPIFAEFSSSNGGWSTATTSTNAELKAYLVAQQDPYDGLVASTVHSWSDDLPVSAIETAYRSAGLGTFQRLKITRRDGNGEWGGRVETAVLEGVNASGAATAVTTTGTSLRSALGLKSSWFKPDNASAPVTITGPSTAPRAQPLILTGTTPAGTVSVVVSVRNQGSTSWGRRTITPRADGSWYTTVTPTVNIAYYATVGSTSSVSKTTLVRGTTISGPASAPKGSVVAIGGWAAPGSAVTVCWKRQAATTCTSTMSRTASTSGWWSASARLYVDYSYFASAAGATSPTLTTHVS